MKMYERWLVYAVTGFLALILVVAVVFGRDPGRDPGKRPGVPEGGKGLKDLIGSNDVKANVPKDGGTPAKSPIAGAERPAAERGVGVPSPGQGTPQQPLVAAPKPLLAADLVAQQLGMSRRDRSVRIVRPRQGDSLDVLVRRWCGARDPYLAEAKSLNEDLVVLRVGQEVAVPWVDDEVLVATLEAEKPRVLVPQDAVGAAGSGASPLPASSPGFALPGATRPNGGVSAAVPGGSGTSSYTVKDGDSLWRIAERTYGRKNADRMVRAIKEANPGLTESVRAGQRIVLPAAPATTGA